MLQFYYNILLHVSDHSVQTSGSPFAGEKQMLVYNILPCIYCFSAVSNLNPDKTAHFCLDAQMGCLSRSYMYMHHNYLL